MDETPSSSNETGFSFGSFGSKLQEMPERNTVRKPVFSFDGSHDTPNEEDLQPARVFSFDGSHDTPRDLQSSKVDRFLKWLSGPKPLIPSVEFRRFDGEELEDFKKQFRNKFCCDDEGQVTKKRKIYEAELDAIRKRRKVDGYIEWLFSDTLKTKKGRKDVMEKEIVELKQELRRAHVDMIINDTDITDHIDEFETLYKEE